MKIVVDQMPDKPSDCPHSIYRDAKSYGWYGCSKRSIVCEIGEPGRECPIYIGLSEALASMANRIPIKKGDAIFYLDDNSGEIEEGIVNTVHYKNGAIDSFSVDFKDSGDFDEFCGHALGDCFFTSMESAQAAWMVKSMKG